MSSLPPESSQHDATALLGPGTLGWCLHLMCYGFIVSQVTEYTTSPLYKADKLHMKLLMWVVFTLETLQVAFNIAQLFNFTTSQRRDDTSLLSGTIIDVIAPLPVGCIAVLVQSYLLHRAAKLIRSQLCRTIYYSVLGLLIVSGLVGSIWTTVAAYGYVYEGQDTMGGASFNEVLALWLWSDATVDVAISATLVLGLRRYIAGFNQTTDTVLRRLIALGLKTGLYTSVLAVCGAVTAVAFKGLSYTTTNIPESFWVPLSGLYTLSLLSTLSSRATLRAGLTGPYAPGAGPSPGTAQHLSWVGSQPGTKSLAGGINIDVDVAVQSEGHRRASAAGYVNPRDEQGRMAFSPRARQNAFKEMAMHRMDGVRESEERGDESVVQLEGLPRSTSSTEKEAEIVAQFV